MMCFHLEMMTYKPLSSDTCAYEHAGLLVNQQRDALVSQQ